MKRVLGAIQTEVRGRWVAWRRARNLRQGCAGAAVQWTTLLPLAGAGVLLAVGGAVVLAGHARQLGAAAVPATPLAALARFQPLLAGASFEVPAIGARIETRRGATLALVAGMRAAAPVAFDLCAPGPIRLGYSLEQVTRLAHPGQLGLAGRAAHGLPRVELNGRSPLELRWAGGDPQARFAGDAGAHALHQDGWLVWPRGALHLWRRPAPGCTAGSLMAQLFLPDPGGRLDDDARVTVYGFNGSHGSHGSRVSHVSARLAPGSYTVPPQPERNLEDQALFEALQARALVRLNAHGLIEVAPRDLPSWRAAAPAARATQLQDWSAVRLDGIGRTLLERLYRKADGAYVRAQIEVFNSERRLLAWRVRPGQGGVWQASVGAAPAQLAAGMPLAATRLFADLPDGWAPWQRLAHWPQAAGANAAMLTLDLPPARGRVEVMLAGRLLGVEGATVRTADACTGRACGQGGAVQILSLIPHSATAGSAKRIRVRAAPLDMAPIAGQGDQQYRHLRVQAGRLVWQALPARQAVARPFASVPVTLTDRHGALLWQDGAPTPQARQAGLATLLGVDPAHGGSVAGMLGRLDQCDDPAAHHAHNSQISHNSHHARLSLDLPLQALTQAVLDCVGMRQGRWRDGACDAGQRAPLGRQAGMVILDAETGDILAAAGAGSAAVTADNWAEARDFDRANPARSALRLPAWQHDGGIHRSPGSTFKIVTALALERAARDDPALSSMLAGMPLADINAMAQGKGYDFRTAAASYPAAGSGARITNFRDQHLDRRAQDGRLGLAQALTYSLNTWFAWSGELSDRTLLGRADGGLPAVRALQDSAFDEVRPVAAMAQRLGFGRPLRLDGGLLPPDYGWQSWDALQATPAGIDPVDTRHELRQLAIGLRMQATPLQMALVAAAVGQGGAVTPRLLLQLDGRAGTPAAPEPLGVRLDRVRTGMKGVIRHGTAAAAFRDPLLAGVRRGLAGKTGTAPTSIGGTGTVWFTGYLEPGSLPGQRRRLALAAFVSHSDATGGEHAAPVVASVLREMALRR